MRASARRWFVLASALGLLVPALLRDLTLPDEPRVAHTSLDLLAGDPVVPRVNGKPFLQTPPLHYWILGGWLRAVGASPDGLARIPSVAFGVGTVLLLGSIVRRVSGSRAAVFATAVLAGTIGWFDGAQRATVDATLTFFVALALCLAARPLCGAPWSAPTALGAGAAAAGAFLTKGLPGPVLVGSALLLPAIVLRGVRSGAGLRWATIALGAFLALSLPWVLALARRDPAAARELLLGHVSARFLEGAHHDPSTFAYIHRSLLKFLPWVVVLPLALARAWQALRRGLRRNDETVGGIALLLSWLCVPLLLLLFSRSRRNIYLLPVYPAAAGLVGLWLAQLTDRGHSFRRLAGIAWLPVLLVPLVGTWYLERTDATPGFTSFCRQLGERARAGEGIVGLELEEREEGALAWYLRGSFPSASDDGGVEAALQEGVERGVGSFVLVGEKVRLEAYLAGRKGSYEVVGAAQLRRRSLEARRLKPQN